MDAHPMFGEIEKRLRRYDELTRFVCTYDPAEHDDTAEDVLDKVRDLLGIPRDND